MNIGIKKCAMNASLCVLIFLAADGFHLESEGRVLENSRQLYCMRANPSLFTEQDKAKLSFLSALDGSRDRRLMKRHTGLRVNRTRGW